MIKTIIFDNNGVLTEERSIANYAKYFNVSEDFLRTFFDEIAETLDEGLITTNEFYQRIAKKCDSDYEYDDLLDLAHDSYPLEADMREHLFDLKKEYEIALLTNFGDVFDVFNDRIWKFQELFDHDKIFVSAKLKMRKPNQDIFLHVLNSLGRAPKEVVFVDDRAINTEAAKALGMKTILFKSPNQFKNELKLLLESEND